MRLRPLVSAACRSRPGYLSRVQSYIFPLLYSASACRSYSTPSRSKKSDPLHILFCGSDEFSCASLEALHAEHQQNPELIKSIDVVIRPGKPTGRGQKKIRHPPIRDVATRLGLPIHERDTFTGWTMPPSINLIIAVSFGLFVPARLIHAAKYGGLNLHPSLLPDFRGPAPLHHTLLAGVGDTGVTLQTLDTAAFDHGVPLAQTPLDDLYHVPPDSTVPQLQAALTPLAAQMLVGGLRDGVHVPPLQDRGWKALGEDAVLRLVERRTLDEDRRAPKIKPQDRQLFPQQRTGSDSVPATAEATATRQRVIGPLWFKARDKHGELKRVIVDDMILVDRHGGLCADDGNDVLERGAFVLDDGEVITNPPIIRMYRFVVHGQSAAEDGSRLTETPVMFCLSSKDDSLYILHHVDRRSKVTTDSGSEQEKINYVRLGRGLRIDTLKVEGEKAKPAKLAFAQFECESVGFELLE